LANVWDGYPYVWSHAGIFPLWMAVTEVGWGVSPQAALSKSIKSLNDRVVFLYWAWSFEFAQVVGKLVTGVLLGCKMVCVQHGLVDVGGTQAAQMRSAVHQDLQQPDDAIVVEADAGHTLALEATGPRQFLQKRVIHFHIQVLGLGVGKALIHSGGASAAGFSAQGFRVQEREPGALSLIPSCAW